MAAGTSRHKLALRTKDRGIDVVPEDDMFPDLQPGGVDEPSGVRPGVAGQRLPQSTEVFRLEIYVQVEELQAGGHGVMLGECAGDNPVPAGPDEFPPGQGGYRLIPAAVHRKIA